MFLAPALPPIGKMALTPDAEEKVQTHPRKHEGACISGRDAVYIDHVVYGSSCDFSKAGEILMRRVQQPESDRTWSVEMNGINPISQEQRHGRPFELFWIWFASNVGILGVVYGASYLAGSGLNLWQGLIVGLTATAVSF